MTEPGEPTTTQDYDDEQDPSITPQVLLDAILKQLSSPRRYPETQQDQQPRPRTSSRTLRQA